MLDECPGCQRDQRAQPIPEDRLLELYGSCKPGDPPEYYYHTLGVVERYVYDGVLYWQCPFCAHKWHRWPMGHRLRNRATPYVEEGQE